MHTFQLSKKTYLQYLTLKSGHTYMPPKKRKSFFHVCHNFHDEAFKISLRFLNKNVAASEELWKDIVDVAIWWDVEREGCSVIGHGTSYVKQLNISNQYSHKITGGALFPLLVVLYRAVLCNTRKDKIDIVLENYGGKSRKTFHSKDTNIAVKMLESALSAATIIDKFAKLCSELLSGDKNIIFGVGACVRYNNPVDKSYVFGVINSIVPSFADSINSPKCFFKTDLEGSEIESEVSDYDDTDDDTLNPISLNISKIKAHKNNCFVPLLKEHKHISTFPVFGKILPIFMQPTSVKCSYNSVKDKSIINIQQYSWSARNAIGEKDCNPQHSVLVGSILSNVYSPQKGPSIFNFSHMKSNIDVFRTSMLENFEKIKSDGNVARMEIAFKKKVDDGETFSFLTDSIKTVVDKCQRHFKAYSVEIVIDIVDFVMKGHLSRVFMLDDLFKVSNDLECYNQMTGILQFFASSASHFYDGRHTFNDLRSYLARCGYLAGRPIFPKLSPILYLRREKILTMKNVDWMSKFYENFNYIPKEIEDCIPVKYCKDMQYCSGRQAYSCNKCWHVFSSSQQINDFDKHNCVDLCVGKKILISSNEFKLHHDENIFRLSTDQKFVFDIVTEPDTPYNYFLTGVAGSGKSTLINVLMEHFVLRFGADGIVCLSQTKNSALIINGVTIHSFFGIGKKDLNLDDVEKIKNELFQLHGDKAFKMLLIKVLIIDEVSLLKDEYIMFFDRFFRLLHNSNLPFGNVMIILAGDVLQLPPIDKTKQKPKYFFQSDAFCKNSFKVAYLRNSHRQNDSHFTSCLNRLRDGMPTDEDIHFINEDCGTYVNVDYFSLAVDTVLQMCDNAYNQPAQDKYDMNTFQWQMKVIYQPRVGSRYVHGIPSQMESFNHPFYQYRIKFAIKEVAEEHVLTKNSVPFVFGLENAENNFVTDAFIKKLENSNKLFKFRSVDTVVHNSSGSFLTQAKIENWLLIDTNLPTVLSVAIGLKVQFTSNTIGTFVANNGFATVVEVNELENIIVVKPHVKAGLIAQNISVCRIEKKSFFEKDTISITRNQFPLKLAYSGNLYTIQGQTFHTPATVLFNHLRLSKKDKNGALYTALSRMSDFKYIKFMFPVTKDDFGCNETALEFDLYHRKNKLIISDVDYFYSDKGVREPNPCFNDCSKRSRTNAYVPTNEAKCFVENHLSPQYINSLLPNAVNLDSELLSTIKRNIGASDTNKLSNVIISKEMKRRNVSFKNMKLINDNGKFLNQKINRDNENNCNINVKDDKICNDSRKIFDDHGTNKIKIKKFKSASIVSKNIDKKSIVKIEKFKSLLLR
jgi:hypothetical protein